MLRFYWLTLAVLFPFIVHADVRCEEPSLLISIGVPADTPADNDIPSERIIQRRKDAFFYVVVTNLSDKPVRIWKQWCSWGGDSVRFSFRDEMGNPGLAVSARSTWTVNFPDFYELAPRESGLTLVSFADPQFWKGFPRPKSNERKKVTMTVTLRIDADDETRKLGIWTGEVSSRPMEYVFVGAEE